MQVLAESGLELNLEVLADSTANIGMHSRIGSGRVRHLDVRWLWMLEAVQSERLSLKKVGIVESVSDLTTKYFGEERLGALNATAGLRLTKGIQLAALVVTPAGRVTQQVAARSVEGTAQAIGNDYEVMKVGRWICMRNCWRA